MNIRSAAAPDAAGISDVLLEAAAWLQARGMPMWRADELSMPSLTADVGQGSFFVAEADGGIAGVVKFQWDDDLFWPDTPPGEAAFVHRLAVRRAFAGGGLSAVLLEWAAERARVGGRRFLRLDCEASRARLRAVYERLGFRHHSDRQVGPYFVARYERALR